MSTLDLSQLEPPSLATLDYADSVDARVARLAELLGAGGIDFDVGALEANPGRALQEVDAYRELLAYSAINDAYRGLLLAFADGAALDHLAATWHGLARQIGESDRRFRARITVEAQAKAGGRLAGYVGEALAADAAIVDANAVVDRSGRLPVVRVAVMDDSDDGVPTAQVVAGVQAHMDRDDIRQATDIVSVVPVELVTTPVKATIEHLPGPDPALLAERARTSLADLISRRRRPGRDLPRSAIFAAASVQSAERVVITAPNTDVTVGPGGLLDVSSVTVTTETVDG